MVSKKRLYLTGVPSDLDTRVVHEDDEARYLLVGAGCELDGEYSKFTLEVQLLNEEEVPVNEEELLNEEEVPVNEEEVPVNEEEVPVTPPAPQNAPAPPANEPAKEGK